MSVKFVPHANFYNEIAHEVSREVLVTAGKAVVAHMKENLPFGKGGGRAVAPFAKMSYVSAAQGSGKNMYVEAGTKWRVANIIEWGSVNSPAYAPLRKAVMQTGLKFTATGPRG